MIRDDRDRAPILWLLLPITAGIVLARLFPETATMGLLPAALAIAVVALMTSGSQTHAITRLWSTALPAAAFLIGLVAFSIRDAHPARWTELPEREMTATLKIDRLFARPDGSSPLSGLARIRETAPHLAELEGQRIAFRFRSAPGMPGVARGQVLEGRGLIHALDPDPDDGFGQYLRDAGVYFEFNRVEATTLVAEPGAFRRMTTRVAGHLESVLRQGLPDSHPLAGVYVAMLLGRKSELSENQRELFLHSGTLHLFAISGLHIGVIAITLYSLFGFLRIPPRIGAALGLAILFIFVDATGGSPSAVRAFAMAFFVWAARVFERPGNLISALAVSALVILLVDPHQLFATSFQLSYGVVLSILLLGVPLGRRWTASWKPFAMRLPDEQTRWTRFLTWIGRGSLSALAVSLAATLVSTPVAIAAFNIWSPGAVIGNVILVPGASLTIVAGCASMLAGMIGLSVLSVLFNHAALVALWAMEGLIRVGILLPGMFWPAALRLDGLGASMLLLLITLLLFGYAWGWKRLPGGFFTPFLALGLFLIFGVTFGGRSQESTFMKSAYELAMERLNASDDGDSKPMTEEMKKRLAEVDTIYKGKIAEREIFLKSTLVQAQSARKWEEVELIEKQIVSERARLEEDREARKERIRQGKA
ncbi:MAG: ComEC/Rec2 family competence protein [Opitutaceae bacterium]